MATKAKKEPGSTLAAIAAFKQPRTVEEVLALGREEWREAVDYGAFKEEARRTVKSLKKSLDVWLDGVLHLDAPGAAAKTGQLDLHEDVFERGDVLALDYQHGLAVASWQGKPPPECPGASHDAGGVACGAPVKKGEKLCFACIDRGATPAGDQATPPAPAASAPAASAPVVEPAAAPAPEAEASRKFAPSSDAPERKPTTFVNEAIDTWRLQLWNAENALSFPEEPAFTIEDIGTFTDLRAELRGRFNKLRCLFTAVEREMDQPLAPGGADRMLNAIHALEQGLEEGDMGGEIGGVWQAARAIKQRGRVAKADVAELRRKGREHVQHARQQRERTMVAETLLAHERAIVSSAQDADPRDREAVAFRLLVDLGVLKLRAPENITDGVYLRHIVESERREAAWAAVPRARRA